MELIVKQTKKELYGAAFDILLKGVEKRGSIRVQGAMGTREGCIQIRFDDSQIQLSPASRREAVRSAGALIKRAPFRPYTVVQDGVSGIVFHDQVKTGFMRYAGYHLLSLGDHVYSLYFVGFGEKGICAPIYQDDRYVSEIRKDCTVTDDLHLFCIVCNELSGIVPFLILCCYVYMITYYRAGEHVIHGKQKSVIITKDDYLLSKCKTLL